MIPTPARCRSGTIPVIVPSGTEQFGPDRVHQVAGVEAAVWAETIGDFDDLTFLLLPRLPGVAQQAWSKSLRTNWGNHRDRLAEHAALWSQDELTYFRAKTIGWPR